MEKTLVEIRNTKKNEGFINKVSKYKELTQAVDSMNREIKELRKTFINKLNSMEADILEGDFFKITYVAEYSRKSFDHKKMLEDHPELASITNNYFKETIYEESVKVYL